MNKKLETLVILLALPSINIHAAESDAVTRHVANNGIDSSSCGTSDSPCRSITRAILNAGEGDTILVGPGRYGDLNADGDFNDPGDELRTALGIAEGCAVCIDKGLNVISTDGAEATVIDAATPTEVGFTQVVRIFADGVRFGAKDGGFTITGGQVYGLLSQARNVRVSGNIALNNPDAGLLFFTVGGPIHVSDNIAIGSGFAGLLVNGNDQATIVANVAIGNPGQGFTILGTGHHLIIDNVSTNNGNGFVVNGSGFEFRRNIASGNAANGFQFSGGVGDEGYLFVLNSVIGNGGDGFSFGPGAHPSIVRRNNIFGNLRGCGIRNESGNFQDARNNFWGSPNGPGPDPADDGGPGCDIAGETAVIPFAARPFVTSPPKR